MALHVSACLSVYLSVASQCSVEIAERIKFILTHRILSAYPTLSWKSGYFPLKVCPKLDLQNFATTHRPSTVIISTDDRRQFIALSIHFCVQHDRRDAACPTGRSVTANGQSVYKKRAVHIFYLVSPIPVLSSSLGREKLNKRFKRLINLYLIFDLHDCISIFAITTSTV